jgi:nucleotide-binding universal stress UspA family protein
VNFRRILVATDFAESAERALACAVQLARRHGAELILLHVYMDLPAYPEITAGQVEAIYEEQRGWIEAALERRARAARGEGLLARSMLRTGPAASTIAETANEEGADLLMIGSHGRSGLDRLILGSVAERVVRLATCPVLVVKSAAAAACADAA